MIAFYISSHGFGHLTRCLAIIKKLLDTENYEIYLVCGESQVQFAKIYLKEYENRLKYSICDTDVGLINKDGTLEVDTERLTESLKEYSRNIENKVIDELNKIKINKLKIEKVICDITPIGFLVGKELKAETIGISNFTWLDQYEALGINKEILEKLYEAYSYCDRFIEYSLALELTGINCKKEKSGFISREIDGEKVKNIKERYGKSIYIGVGKSADLGKIEILNFDGTVFYTSGIEIEGSGFNKEKLPFDILDMQNYVAASETAIIKAGWGTIAECMVGHTPPVLIERKSVYEDTVTINKLVAEKLAISITEAELKSIDIDKILNRLEKEINYKELNKIESELKKIVEIIIKEV